MRALKIEKRKRRENILPLHCNILEVYKENFTDSKDRFEAGMWAFGACKEKSKDFHEVGISWSYWHIIVGENWLYENIILVASWL